MAATVTELSGRISTRERIIRTAGSLFADKGFYGASIGTLASALGVAKASVMHHIKSKNALYDEVVARIAETVHEPLKDALDNAAGEADAMRKMVDVLVEWTQARPDYAKLIVRNLLDNTEEMSTVRWHFGPVIAQMLQVIEEGQRAGVVRQSPPLLLLEMILGVLFYHLMAEPAQAGILGTEAAREFTTDFSASVRELLESAVLIGHKEP